RHRRIFKRRACVLIRARRIRWDEVVGAIQVVCRLIRDSVTGEIEECRTTRFDFMEGAIEIGVDLVARRIRIENRVVAYGLKPGGDGFRVGFGALELLVLLEISVTIDSDDKRDARRRWAPVDKGGLLQRRKVHWRGLVAPASQHQEAQAADYDDDYDA